MFFTASPKRHTAFVKCQQDLHPGECVIQLSKLSDTRWACREKALKALNKVMDAVVKVLTDLTVQEPPDTAAGDARMYLNAIDFEFLLCLAIATPVFNVTALASDALQNQDIDLSMAYSVVWGVMDTLSNLRTEEQFSKLFKNATEKAEASGIGIPTGRGRFLQNINIVLLQPQRATRSNQRKSTTESRCSIHSLMFFLRNYIGGLREMGRHSPSKYSVHSTV